MSRAMGGERLRVVAIGGGTGLSVLLRGLGQRAAEARRRRRGALEVTAVVSTADDGGSTGTLRRHLGIPAVGDLRNCLVALSGGQPLWGELFQHRFAEGDGLSGHALGNLIVAALIERAGGLSAAIEQLALPLGLRGRVLPVTDERVTLYAELEGGGVVPGESRIPGCGRPIARLGLCPRDPAPAPGVLAAIAAADAVVFGPGSLYTSIVPNLLVAGVAQAIRQTAAVKIFVCNLTTQHGETDGFDATRHLRALDTYLGRGAVDVCLVDGSETPVPLPVALSEPPAGSAPRRVAWTRRGIASTGALPMAADLAAGPQQPGRHDPLRLADAVLALAREHSPRRRHSRLIPETGRAAASPMAAPVAAMALTNPAGAPRPLTTAMRAR